MNSDKQLVEAAIQGDTDAFGELVRKYSNALYAVAYGVLGDFHLAKDIAQETFLRAYLRLPTLSDGNKVGSWLYSVAYHLSIDWKRKRKNVVLLEDIEFTPAIGNLEEEIVRRGTSEEIWKILNTLHETNRVPVILYYISEWSMREIADFLGIHLRAVESRLQRSKKILRAELADYIGDALYNRRLTSAFDEEVMLKIPTLIGIPCVNIRVRDQHKAQAWYETVLGIDFDQTPNAGSVNIGFLVDGDPVPAPYPLFAFITDNLKETYLVLTNLGIQFIDDHDPNRFLFCDPDGNILCFMEK